MNYIFQINSYGIIIIFLIFELDNRGFITFDEFKDALKTVNISDKTAQEIMKKIDLDDDNEISLQGKFPCNYICLHYCMTNEKFYIFFRIHRSF